MMQYSESDILAPAIYYCDMSRQLMRDPVISTYGYTFERRAIMNWLSLLGNDFCPCSGKDMTIQDLIDARNLKNEINTWRAEHGLPSDNIIGRTVVIMGGLESSSLSNIDTTNKSLHQDSGNHQSNNDWLEQDIILGLDDKESTNANHTKNDIPKKTSQHKGRPRTTRLQPMAFAPLRKLLRVHPESV